MSRLIKEQSEEQQKPSWVRYVHNRIRRKKNFLCLVSGVTGSGKSWSCLSVALMLDPNFSHERIVFGLRGLMRLINSAERYPRGTVFCWDEFQVGASSRNWLSLTNKLLGNLLSTFRHKNFILLINAPFSDFVDSQARKLFHAEWECMRIDYATEEVVLKPLLSQYNSKKKKFYHKYLRVGTAKGVSPVTRWRIPKPPKWIVEEYERKKNEFTSALNKDIERQLDELEGKRKKKPLAPMQQKVFDAMLKYKDTSKVAEELSISVRTVNFHLVAIRKKGYDYDDNEENEGNTIKIEQGEVITSS